MDIRAYNRDAWNKEVNDGGNRWTQPVSSEIIAKARQGNFSVVLTENISVPQNWFPTLKGADVLCLASGGGQQGPIFAAIGAHVTVFDNSPGQLSQDQLVAEREALSIQTVEGDAVEPAATLPMEQTQARYYLRLTCRDQPGVMGQVSQILGQHGISLSAILQRETTEDGQFVPVVITTHRATEGPMRESVKALDRLPTVMPPTVCLRIIDQPKEFAAS